MTTRLGLDAIVAMNGEDGVGDKLGPNSGDPTALAFEASLDRIKVRDLLHGQRKPWDDYANLPWRDCGNDWQEDARRDVAVANATVGCIDKERERIAMLATRGNPGAGRELFSIARVIPEASGDDCPGCPLTEDMTYSASTVATLDVRVENHGSIVLFFGATERGQSWLDQSLDPNAFRIGKGIVVEPRYASDIMDGAIRDGLMVA